MTATRVRYLYRSGWCGMGQHAGCRGEYAGTKCHCPCGHNRRRVAAVTYGCTS